MLILAFYTSNCFASDLFGKYDQAKESFTEQTGIHFGLDNTITVQYSPSEGGQTLTRQFISPYLNIELFNNAYGQGHLNFLMNFVRFNRQNSTEFSSAIGVANQINSYDVDYNELSELYYAHTFGGNYDWLTLGLGQFSLASFDNITVGKLQNQYFLNNALAQDGTFTYPSAGIGAFVTSGITNELSISVGATDASNPSASGISSSHLERFVTFASLNYTPQWYNSYQGSYTLLFYNKPSVKEAPENSTGVSLYLAQDINDKTSLFFRFNHASGNYAALDYSYALGVLFNNPFNREQNDQFAVAYAYNKVNSAAAERPVFHKQEHTIETYYDYKINQHLAVRPDMQLYLNPAFDKKSGLDSVFSLSLYIGF